MERVVLISDVQTPLGEELARRYLAVGARVAATRSNQDARESPLVSESDGFLLTDWNRRSAISARNVLLAVLNRFGRIDEAVVLGTPAPERRQLHELAFDSIERGVDTWVKGSLFLVKGVLETFGKNGGGRLALVHHALEEAGTALPPLEASLRGAFRAMTQSLLDTHSQPEVFIHGFESFSTQARDYAGFIVETMTERGGRAAGKWFRFQPKGGFLAPLRGWKNSL